MSELLRQAESALHQAKREHTRSPADPAHDRVRRTGLAPGGVSRRVDRDRARLFSRSSPRWIWSPESRSAPRPRAMASSPPRRAAPARLHRCPRRHRPLAALTGRVLQLAVGSRRAGPSRVWACRSGEPLPAVHRRSRAARAAGRSARSARVAGRTAHSRDHRVGHGRRRRRPGGDGAVAGRRGSDLGRRLSGPARRRCPS